MKKAWMLRQVALALTAGVVLAASTFAQGTETYKIRLAPVAIDAAMKNNIAGLGSVTAVLAGTKLTVNGTFEGLKSNATVAHIHQGTAPGVRGPRLMDLTVTKSTNGNLSGSFDLTQDQMARLKKGHWYVQIHSEKAPEGNLWGWLYNK